MGGDMSDQRHDDAHHDDDVFVDPSAAWDGDDPFVDLPGWPKPVGIISIAWGALGLFCGVLAVGGPALMRSFMQSAQNQMQGGLPDVLVNPPASAQAAQFSAVAWAVFLIVCGGMLIARKPVSRLLHIVYAVGAIALTVWGVYEQLQVQIQMQEWIDANPDSDFARAAGAGGGAGGMIGLAIGLVIGFAWPLFCLVWFGLVKRKPTDIVGEGERLQPAA
jgi:hypothetical protein